MKRLYISLLILLLVVTGSLIYLLIAIGEDQPMVVEAPVLNASYALGTKEFVKYLIREVSSDQAVTTIEATANDINGLIVLVNNAFPRIHGRANLSRFGLLVAFSVFMPENPFGNFINISLTLEPSNRGLKSSQVSIGNLIVSGEFVLKVAEFAMNRILIDDGGTQAINAVQKINFAQDKVYIHLTPIRNLSVQVDHLRENLAFLRDEIDLFNRDLVMVYYGRLCEAGMRLQGINQVSAAYYIQSAFELSHQRSLSSETAVNENQAALVALGLYLGGHVFAPLIGKIEPSRPNSCDGRYSESKFQGRRDLVLHFFYSVMIKILTNRGVSFTAGEYKEMLDSTRTRGGASFSDIAADLAGIKFSEELLNPERAWSVQQILMNNADESVYFPDISNLPDDLSQSRFEQEYGGLDDQRYIDMIEMIKREINQLPLYR